jgi:hypothetical protein
MRRVPSRRDVLRGLAGAGFGLGAARLPGSVAAKKKHKHKRKAKKASPNAFGCIEAGKSCASAQDCCSGICQGKKGKKRCQAHGTGTCDQGADGLCEAGDPTQTACNDGPTCVCLRTTADSQFCGDVDAASGSDCADCQKDADCEALGFPAGSACVPFSEGRCSMSTCAMVCVVPCGTERPES